MGEFEQVLTDRSILVAKGYPKDFVKLVRLEGLCPWVVSPGVDPGLVKLILCGSVHGVDKIVLDDSAPKGPFDKATFLSCYPAFAALEPEPGASARPSPEGEYYMWKVK